MTLPLRTLRFCTWGYWAFLTYTLVSVAPWDVLGADRFITPRFDPAAPVPSLILHTGAYLLLGGLLFLSFRDDRRWKKLRNFALVHAFVCEALQGFIPGRFVNPWDVAANLLGLFVVWGVLSFFERKHQKIHDDAYGASSKA